LTLWQSIFFFLLQDFFSLYKNFSYRKKKLLLQEETIFAARKLWVFIIFRKKMESEIIFREFD